MPMPAVDIQQLISASLPGSQIAIQDLAGDDNHFSVEVVAKQFQGKTRVQQHQMVYQALQGKVGGDLHALALKTCPLGT